MNINNIWLALILVSFLGIFANFGIAFYVPVETECIKESKRQLPKDSVIDTPTPGLKHALEIFSCGSQLLTRHVKDSWDRIMGLIAIITFWLGIMKIGEHAGLIQRLARWFYPIFKIIYPKIPEGHPALSSIMMNMSANMLGLDNAATPLGLRAMKDLQELNENKDTASDAMIMFMVLNTAGITLIPTGVIAARASYGAADPSDIFLPSLLGTLFSFLCGLVITSLVQKIPVWRRSFLIFTLGICIFMASMLFVLIYFKEQGATEYLSQFGSMLLLLVILWFIYYGIRSKINVYESFIEGAKEGFTTAVSILPYIVLMFFTISLLKVSGIMDLFVGGVSFLLSMLHMSTEFVPAIPIALFKILNGGAARALMMDNMGVYGADSFIGRVGCVIQGSTETTLYVLSVYFGSVHIKKLSYAPMLGIIIDLVGAAFAIFLTYLFFA